MKTDTEYLNRIISQCDAEVGSAAANARRLGEAISDLVNDFVQKHGGNYSYAMDYASDMISDLVYDACKVAEQNKQDAEIAIADAEWQDTRRNGPVVL
jgi:hypothetical protein